MAATAAQIAQLRRMVAEPTTTTYDDDALTAYIEARPLVDSLGRTPDHDDWDGTYDLNGAASAIWEEKAAALADKYDVNADGADLARSQRFEHACKMARRYSARRATGSARMYVTPRIPATDTALETELLALEDAIEAEEDA